ncbi:hypothetical protein HY570_02175 [Candidatus Micrarchaeota archaeon]|nr:hypothetical protein [Candidatus Micrarchaeota archaeon]
MLKMKKGFVFAIMFLLFFTLFLSFSIFYSQLKKEAKPQTLGFILDDIRDDITKLYGTKTLVRKYGNYTEVTFVDSLPNTINSTDQGLEDYNKFLKTTYNSKTNNNITLNSITPVTIVNPFGLEYRHDSLKKNKVSITSRQPIGAYLIQVRLPSSCDFFCRLNTQTNWDWADDGIYVVLDIRDPDNNALLVQGNTSGFINKSSSIDLSLGSGSYHLDVFDSLNQEVSSLNINSNISIYYISTPATTVSMPVDLEINDVKLKELVISKN